MYYYNDHIQEPEPAAQQRTQEKAEGMGYLTGPMEGRLHAWCLPTDARVEGLKTQSMYIDLNKDNNRHPTILKDILHISFPKLKFLSLESNNIMSIEGIEAMMMPKLQELRLRKDGITKTTIKSRVFEPWGSTIGGWKTFKLVYFELLRR